MRVAAGASHSGSGLPVVLGVDSAPHAAALRTMRRSTAHVAGDQRAAGAVSTLPPDPARRRSRARCWGVPRRLAGNRPRVQVRRPSIARPTAGGSDAQARHRRPRGRVVRDSGPAPRLAPAAARLQSGERSRAASGPSGGARLAARPSHRHPDRSAGRTAASKCARCVCRHAVRVHSGKGDRRPRRRREHDGRDAGSVRACAERGGREGSASTYSCESSQ